MFIWDMNRIPYEKKVWGSKKKCREKCESDWIFIEFIIPKKIKKSIFKWKITNEKIKNLISNKKIYQNAYVGKPLNDWQYIYQNEKEYFRALKFAGVEVSGVYIV